MNQKRVAVGRLVMQTTVAVYNITKIITLILVGLSSGTLRVLVVVFYQSQSFKLPL